MVCWLLTGSQPGCTCLQGSLSCPWGPHHSSSAGVLCSSRVTPLGHTPAHQLPPVTATPPRTMATPDVTLLVCVPRQVLPSLHSQRMCMCSPCPFTAEGGATPPSLHLPYCHCSQSLGKHRTIQPHSHQCWPLHQHCHGSKTRPENSKPSPALSDHLCRQKQNYYLTQ